MAGERLIPAEEVADRFGVSEKTHPDIFTADEARQYLKLPSRRAFNEKRLEIEREMKVKIRGVRTWRQWLYSRQQLDQMKRLMFSEMD